MEPNIINEVEKQVVQNSDQTMNIPGILATEVENKNNIVKDENAPLYYSKSVINTFSILLSALFGAILLAINLRKINKKAAWQVVILGFIYIVIVIFILNKMNLGSTWGIIFNGIGAYILNEYFWNKYIGKDTKYRARKPWMPTIIAILMIAAILFFTIFYRDQLLKNNEVIQNGQQGVDYINAGQYKEAIDSFTVNINKNDNDVPSYTFRGLAKFKSEDFSGARSDLEYALALKDDNFNYRPTHYYLGMIQGLVDKEPQLAISNFTIALNLPDDLNISDESIYYQRALSNLALQNSTEALNDVNKVIESDSEYKNILTKNALAIRAMIEVQTGDLEAACTDATNSKDISDSESDLGKAKTQIIAQACK